MSDRRLYRSSRDKTIGGVCAGLGYYLDLDPTLIRLLAVIALLMTWPVAIIVYIFAWIIMPSDMYLDEPISSSRSKDEKGYTYRHTSVWYSYLPGIILIAIGAFLFAHEYYYWIDWEYVWPMVLIVLGGAMLIFGFNRHRQSVNDSQGHEHHQDYNTGSPYHDPNDKGQSPS